MKLQSQGTPDRNLSTASRTLKGPELMHKRKGQQREKTATISSGIGHTEIRARSTKVWPKTLAQLKEEMPIIGQDGEGGNQGLLTETTATGEARVREQLGPNTASMKSITKTTNTTVLGTACQIRHIRRYVARPQVKQGIR